MVSRQRWQKVSAWLVVIWLGIAALPMLLSLLSWDPYGLLVYFGMWLSFIVFPTAIVYLVVMVIGTLLSRAVH